MTDTLLVLSGMGIAPYSARGLTQTLQPIAQAAQQRRTVNGDLVDLSAAQFRKYRSTITCTDQNAPQLEGIWPGVELVVDCVQELSFETMTGAPAREAAATREQDGVTWYRPRLTMLVTDFQVQTDEYGAAVGWTLSLEEV